MRTSFDRVARHLRERSAGTGLFARAIVDVPHLALEASAEARIELKRALEILVRRAGISGAQSRPPPM